MKNHINYLFLCGICLSTVSKAGEDDDTTIVRRATDLTKLVRITNKPHLMSDPAAGLCRAPIFDAPHNVHIESYSNVYCNVYVTKNAANTIKSGVGKYPAGALIVKTKLKTEDAKRAMLYTVMRKMPKGYDADHGDWEYSVIDGATHQIQARGRIDSCIGCHDDYRSTDFVTREYLPKPKPIRKP